MINQDSSALRLGTRIEQYLITGVLGRGGFGITYLVRDEALRKNFALKEFFPEGLVRREGTDVRFVPRPNGEDDYRWGLKKFYDEARLLAQFSHPNIVSVRRVFEANNCAYMLLDFIRGRTLETWLQGLDSPPTQEELDLISEPLMSALELVHANRTWHLDISPENVMIRSSDGAPVLLDFGASRFELKQHSQLVSALVFKTGYSAPEQYTSNAERYGPWTDIYAFAATLYRAIAGSRLPDATARQLGEEQKPAALLGEGRYRDEFLEAIDWALQIPPRERPQSIGEWRGALLQGSGASDAPGAARKARDRRAAALSKSIPVSEGFLTPLEPLPAPVRKGVSVSVLVASIIISLGLGAAATHFGPDVLRRVQERVTVATSSTVIDAAKRRTLYNTTLTGDVLVADTKRNSLEDCRSACLATNGCKALEFRARSPVCFLYRSVSKQDTLADAIAERWD